MPLTGLIVLLWVYSDNPKDLQILTSYCKGAMWGILPTLLFFFTAFLCFRKELSLWAVLCISFCVWLGAAFIHQWLLGR
jgi:uncharacterized membrane protein (GlpM family)